MRAFLRSRRKQLAHFHAFFYRSRRNLEFSDTFSSERESFIDVSRVMMLMVVILTTIREVSRTHFCVIQLVSNQVFSLDTVLYCGNYSASVIVEPPLYESTGMNRNHGQNVLESTVSSDANRLVSPLSRCSLL